MKKVVNEMNESILAKNVTSKNIVFAKFGDDSLYKLHRISEFEYIFCSMNDSHHTRTGSHSNINEAINSIFDCWGEVFVLDNISELVQLIEG